MKKTEKPQKKQSPKKGLSLETRLTALVGIVVLTSILVSFGLSELLEWLLPSSTHIPLWIQVNIFSLIVAIISARFLSRLLFEPIKELCGGMQRVANGDFSTRLESKSSSTEVQELFAGFNLMTKELSSTEILQTDFVSNVSHEFKTPINAIEGYTTLLQGGDNLDADQQKYVDKILFNTKRLSALVSNILLLSKIENLSIQTNQEWYALDEQIRESIVALESAWAPKNIEFDVDLDNLPYYGNEVLMHHVWDNLIGNAIKFSPEGGEIRIHLFKENQSLICTVEDRGPGLSEEAKKHIFDKFYQEDTSHKEEGNGLGLTLVKRILTIAHGEISAENRPDGGCRFTVVLPTKKQ